MCRTGLNALCTEPALIVVYVRQVVRHRDGLKLAHRLAFATAYAGRLTRLTSHSPLVLIDTRHEDAPAFRPFLTELYDVAWASTGASATCGAHILINFGQPSLLVHVYPAKVAN